MARRKHPKGRYREFCQCDFDIIGVDSVHADIDAISCIATTLQKLTDETHHHEIGHRTVLTAALQVAFPSFSDREQLQALIALDKLDKMSSDDVAALLCKIPGATMDSSKAILNLLNQKTPDGSSNLNSFKDFLKTHPAAIEAIERIALIRSTLESIDLLKNSHVKFRVDFSIARGLAYYGRCLRNNHRFSEGFWFN